MERPRAGVTIAVLAALSLSTCSDAPAGYTVYAPPRDWALHPALVDRAFPSDAAVYAVSDVHGGYARLASLLARHGLLASVPATPADAQWRGGRAVLVVAGDLIDKGPDSLDAIDLLRVMEPAARAAGGEVIVLLGNHEAEFLADPHNAKAAASDGLDAELSARGLDVQSLADGRDVRGVWLRDRAFGARVGGWFFSHAGATGGRSFEALGRALRASVEADDYRGAEVLGDGSIVEARDWWTASRDTVADASRALGVAHFVFGHTPSALGPRGAIATAADGALVRIDCGMSPGVDDSRGALLRVRVVDGHEVADALDADGRAHTLWRAP